MHRSWLRDKLAESTTKMTGKVTERARSMVPKPRVRDTDTCMVCGRNIRPGRLARGEGRVCSPTCAKTWTQGL